MSRWLCQLSYGPSPLGMLTDFPIPNNEHPPATPGTVSGLTRLAASAASLPVVRSLAVLARASR